MTRYSEMSRRRVARRNRSVEPGHSVVLRPAALRYQLTQPPVAQTEDAIRASMPADQRSSAPGRASRAAAPVRSSTAREPRMKRCWDAMMWLMELWPGPVMGPYDRHELGYLD